MIQQIFRPALARPSTQCKW